MDSVDRALADWKSNRIADEALSPGTRARIVETALQETADQAQGWAPAFRPMRWLALVGIIPVAAVAVLLILPQGEEARIVGAEKVGDEIVFHIADGDRSHTVTRSTDPRRFNARAAATVDDGVYSDRANSGPVLVFYKLD